MVGKLHSLWCKIMTFSNLLLFILSYECLMGEKNKKIKICSFSCTFQFSVNKAVKKCNLAQKNCCSEVCSHCLVMSSGIVDSFDVMNLHFCYCKSQAIACKQNIAIVHRIKSQKNSSRYCEYQCWMIWHSKKSWDYYAVWISIKNKVSRVNI